MANNDALFANEFSIAPSRRKSKKRLLPDIFYLRWELELLLSCMAITVLLLVPQWLNNRINEFLSGHDTSMNTTWITLACNILLAGFISYLVLRSFWLFYIHKGEKPTLGRLHFAKATGEIAEVIFSLCLIVLMILLLVSIIEFFAILLKNWIPGDLKYNNGVNQ